MRTLDEALLEQVLSIIRSGPGSAENKLAAVEAILMTLKAPRDERELQQVLNAVYQGAAKECEGREREGKLVGNGHHMAQSIVENVKAELLRRGLFVKTTPQASDDDQPSFAELRAKNIAEGGCGCAPGTILCPH